MTAPDPTPPARAVGNADAGATGPVTGPVGPTSSGLRVVPCELADANAFVAARHRHHKPAVGHRFSVAVEDRGGVRRGVAICGRPVARMAGKATLEVTRLCTDGTRNACSILYAACARAAEAMGYDRIQTYILESEPGTSLRAAGWILEAMTAGGQWDHTSPQGRLFDGPNRRTDQPTDKKQRWAKVFRAPRPVSP